MAVIKNNVGRKPNFLFELDFSNLDKVFDQPKLNFLGETDLLAHEVGLDEKTEPKSVVDECAEVILEYLEKEGRKESKTLDTYLKSLDFKEKTIKRARAQLKNKIKAVKEGQRWVVELRDPVDPLES
jgi:lipoate-protein ligase A